MQFWFSVIGYKLYEPFAYNGLRLHAVAHDLVDFYFLFRAP
jgi:hypothetical protein